jgi:hypothetical protein
LLEQIVVILHRSLQPQQVQDGWKVRQTFRQTRGSKMHDRTTLGAFGSIRCSLWTGVAFAECLQRLPLRSFDGRDARQ